MVDVFISYAREDLGFVRQVHSALQQGGREVWVDLESIPPSADWLAEIRLAIESSNVFVFVISPESITSSTCLQELDHAAGLGKRIVPLARRSVSPERLPAALAARQWIPFTDSDAFDTGMDGLAKAIDTDLDWVRAHTRLLVRAREWEIRGLDKSQLLRGTDLQNAEQQEATHQQSEPKFTDLQARYILASRRAAVAFQRRVLAAVGTGMAIALVLAAIAYYQFTLSERRQRIAVSRQLAAQALGHIELQHDLALLLSVEAFRSADLAEARSSLLTALQRHPHLAAWLQTSARQLGAPGPHLQTLAISPDGHWLAVDNSCATVARMSDVAFRCTGSEIAFWSLGERPTFSHVVSISRPIADMVFRPNGAELFVISSGGAVHSYPVGRTTPSSSKAYTTEVRGGGRALAVRPDGAVIAAAGDDGTIRIVNTRSPNAGISQHRVHDRIVWDLAFSPDGRQIAWAADDGAVGLLRTGVHSSLGRHGSGSLGRGAHVVAFSPDGKVLASGGDDGSVVLWDTRTGGRRATLQYHTSRVAALAFSPDGTVLASGAWDHVIAFWDVASGQRLPDVLDGHRRFVAALTFTSDGRFLISGDGDGGIALWHPPDRHARPPDQTTFTPNTFAVAFSPDGKWVASSRGDQVVLWDPDTEREIGPLQPAHSRLVQRVAFSGDGRLLASAALDHVTLWDMHDQLPIANMSVEGMGYISTLHFSRDAAMLAAGGSTEMRELEIRGNPDAPVIHLVSATSRDGQRAAQDSTGIILLWHLPRRERTVIRHAGGSIDDLGFTVDDRSLVASTSEGELLSWNRRDLKGDAPAPTVLTSGIRASVFALHPTRDIMAAGYGDAVFVWDFARRQPVGERWTGHSSTVYGIAYSPDGRFLASGGADGRVIVWESETGQRIGEFGRPGYWFSEVAFGRGGTKLVAGTDQSTVLFWDVDVESWKRRACTIANRSLTQREWSQYVGASDRLKTCPTLPLQ